MSYLALCTGCERYVYETATSPPCPVCFPSTLGLRSIRLATAATAAAVEEAAERLEEIFA